jgi:hypothetical protein
MEDIMSNDTSPFCLVASSGAPAFPGQTFADASEAKEYVTKHWLEAMVNLGLGDHLFGVHPDKIVDGRYCGGKLDENTSPAVLRVGDGNIIYIDHPLH